MPETYEDQPYDIFVIEVSEEVWDHLKLPAKKALIDHELAHCEIETDEDGRTSLAIRGHDVEEFEAIVKRHGLWKQDVEDLVRAGAEQLSLDALEEAVDAATQEDEERENLDVSITHNGRTVHTNTATLGRMAAGEVPTGARS